MASAAALRRCFPMFDRVLIKKAEAVTKSKGGIMIPEKSQTKVLKGTVLATGTGARNQHGSVLPLAVNPGDVVVLPEYGGIKVDMQDDNEYHLYREADILAVVDELMKKYKLLFDRVLVKKADPVKQSKGGIVIPEKAQERVTKGVVVSVGPGKRNKDGKIIPIAVREGDVVLLPEYGGTKLKMTDEEEECFVFREYDILARVE